MQSSADALPHSRDAGLVRLDTLVRLRWLAVTGQSIAVVGVHFGLGFSLPFGLCFLLIAASAWLNIALRLRYPMSHWPGLWPATALLAYDLTQLAGLLYLTGGLQNPFAILFLAPVLISATTLPPGATMALGALSVFYATCLMFWRYPLPWRPGETLELPFVYIIGIWTSITLGIAFTAIYAWRVADEARTLARALAATELVLAREQHLSQLDGLAAAAAHELGTPLATITLVTKEMAREAPPGSPLAEDIALLREQVERCRNILGKLTSLGSDSDANPLQQLTLSHLVEEAAGPQRPFGVPITVVREGEGPQPVCRRNPGVIYGLGNIIDNAVDFARNGVTIEERWNDQFVEIVVRDDGPGFAPEVLLRIGEPYVTTRGAGQSHADEPASGLGLGLFIARSLIERTGAEIATANAPPPESGAVVRIRWPRHAFERGVSGASA
ncbi:ActS/PrrB/RegB family redox-sensitive histidine kinase [Camelimonas abortus]|uniref:histidine kinase n=1 Tax=Camelimonas abortus TaxID=1017184 RepID=A0ABV7LHS6_9HYPH